MKKLRRLSLIGAALLTALAFAACTDEDSGNPDPGPTPPPGSEDVVQLSSDGEQKAVTVPISEPWEAT